MDKAILELRHDGTHWYLDITIEGQLIQVGPISYEQKEELAEAGVVYYFGGEE